MARLTPSQIRAYWLAAGGGSQVVQSTAGAIALDVLMTAIALAESREGDPAAINPGVGAGGRRTNEYSVGLWQINTLVHKTYSVSQLKDPAINASEAVRIYRTQGLRAWGAYTDGRFRSYLKTAMSSAGAVVVPTSNSVTELMTASYVWIPILILGLILAIDE